RGQRVAGGVVGLDAVLGEESAELDVHALADGGEVALGVELDRVDAVAGGPALVGGELAVEDAARQGEAVVGAGQDPVAAEAERRLGGAAGDDGALAADPVLLQREV